MAHYHPLNEAEAVAYAKRLRIFPEDARLTAREIGDGNLNLVFRIQEEATDRSIIIKQALPYARVVGDSWPLTLDRARIESEALHMEEALCPGSVPKVYHYDPHLALTVMEDLSSHIVLRKGLILRRRYPKLAQHIGTFLARTLFYTSDIALNSRRKKEQVAQFINPEMCRITEDLVFTDPFYNAETNRFNPLILEEVRKIWSDGRLKLEVAALKEGFLTRTQALIHGDLHTGSIMVTEQDTRVIDPEFAYYGPMGFDIGAVLANLFLNFSAQEGLTDDPAEKSEYQVYLLRTAAEIWSVFERNFRQLWWNDGLEAFTSVHGYLDDYLERILQDTAGYAGCKMIRRVIGLAHVADLESIEDPKLRAKGETMALAIGRELILARHGIQRIEDILQIVQSIREERIAS
ncbi:Methylthioribose kinase [[Clostridium] ultunense Esp]|uniref:S-methyl-5-thioribose kinase n=1 Tax=Thermicanus aegyptius TaxID=94009 RepID=UPI0002B6F5BE|nr:S-methyl-5-thioribose kinase [Thermicanus aegyptius]CCQ95484.1 Methylthioribose kinase [[Clostridium] ultunense Esp]